MSDGTQILPARSVIGNQVRNSRGESLGRVEELIIDPETGRIVGALLSHQSIQRGKQLAAIPWHALTLDKSDGVIYVDSEIVEHPLRRDKDWPETGVPEWPRNIVVYTYPISKAGSEVK